MTSYRKLLNGLPFRPNGLMLSRETCWSEGPDKTYLSLNTINNDICLYIEVEWLGKCIICS